MTKFDLDTTKDLKFHDEIIKKIFSFFYNTPGVIGCFVSGSTATGNMDIDSDLDLGFLIENKDTRSSIWENRWNWKIAPWFHRFDADHIKPYFVIYLFEPQIKADINLHIIEDLPHKAGCLYTIIWDKEGLLDDLYTTSMSSPPGLIDWSNSVHEDERFWAWLFYLYGHIHRGEYYNSAMEYPALRDIFEQWTARLNNQNKFSSRRLELKHYAKELINGIFFPEPNKKSLKKTLIKSIEYYLKLRKKVEIEQKIKWKTSDKAINKIYSLIKGL